MRLNRKLRARKSDLSLLAEKAVPKGLPPDVREDVKQELIMKMLKGEFDVSEIRANVQPCVRKIFGLSANKQRHVFLDHPLPGSDGGVLLRDMLVG